MAQLSTLIRKVSRTDTDAMFRTLRDMAEVNTIVKASAERRLTDRLIEVLANHEAIVIDDNDPFVADMLNG